MSIKIPIAAFLTTIVIPKPPIPSTRYNSSRSCLPQGALSFDEQLSKHTGQCVRMRFNHEQYQLIAKNGVKTVLKNLLAPM
jgi:hypothetical protein